MVGRFGDRSVELKNYDVLIVHADIETGDYDEIEKFHREYPNIPIIISVLKAETSFVDGSVHVVVYDPMNVSVEQTLEDIIINLVSSLMKNN